MYGTRYLLIVSLANIVMERGFELYISSMAKEN